MAFAQLGSLKWRIDPNEISWDYQIDANRIETLGGQVVQILGATLGDVTISGDFGQDRTHKQESWQLALAFNKKIQQMMDQQTLPAKRVTIGTKGVGTGVGSILNKNTDAAVVHQPVTFSYMDGVHNWQFKVLIKSIVDSDGSGAAVTHSTGKYSYGYQLTLFIVEAQTDIIKKIATDAYIARISNGLGWKQSKFNGPLTGAQAAAFIQAHGGSVTAYLGGILTGGA